MSFFVVYGNGELECNDFYESVALQYPESLNIVCPGCDLLLLTDVHPQVLYALGSEFTVSDTLFGGAVATKWTISNWTENRKHMCRFDIHHKITVTFGMYSTLYNLENDMPVLTLKPCYFQHFVCIVIPRTLNWQKMVQMCSYVLQIQYPVFSKYQCQAQRNIVLMGWQRGSVTSYSAPLEMYNSLQLHTPIRDPRLCTSITRFNQFPVYILYFVMKSQSRQKLKQRRILAREDNCLPEVNPECKIDIVEECFQIQVHQKMQDQLPKIQVHQKMQEQLPKMQDQLPKMQEQLPKMQEQLPKMQEQLPKMQEQLPKMQDQLPKMQDQLPKMQEEPQIVFFEDEVEEGLEKVIFPEKQDQEEDWVMTVIYTDE
jgi:hypothetical protein